MEVHDYVNQNIELNEYLLVYIESEQDYENEENDTDFQKLINFFQHLKIKENQQEFKKFIRLLYLITKNHHRCHNFFHKIEKICFI